MPAARRAALSVGPSGNTSSGNGKQRSAEGIPRPASLFLIHRLPIHMIGDAKSRMPIAICHSFHSLVIFSSFQLWGGRLEQEPELLLSVWFQMTTPESAGLSFPRGYNRGTIWARTGTSSAFGVFFIYCSHVELSLEHYIGDRKHQWCLKLRSPKIRVPTCLIFTSTIFYG